MHDYSLRIKQKGWKMAEVAERWQISVRRLAQIAANPTLRDWDAVRGLPHRRPDVSLIGG